jgi:RNA polymerase sporulation-specific sigma factor
MKTLEASTHRESRVLSAEDLADSALVLEAQNGSDRALAEILAKYSPAARNTGYRYFIKGAEGSDVVQEAMVGLYKAVRDFDPSKCPKFRVFATICITRQVMTAAKYASRLKHNALTHAASIDDADLAPITQLATDPRLTDPAELVENAENIEELRRALLSMLTKLESSALALYVQGKSYAEIARETGARVKAVDNAIQRVRKKVQQFLHERVELTAA